MTSQLINSYEYDCLLTALNVQVGIRCLVLVLSRKLWMSCFQTGKNKEWVHVCV